MIVALARFELRILRRDRRAWWALLALAAFVVTAFVGSTVQAARENAGKASVAAAERQRWLDQGEKDPHSAAHYSVYAFRPSPPLAGLDGGAIPFVGDAIWLEAHHQNDPLNRPQQDASQLQRAGLASPASLILELGPLIVLLLAFTAVARDRERGSLRLGLGNTVQPQALVLGKVVAIWGAAIAVLVAPVSALAGTTLFFTATSGDAWLRLMLWSLLMAGYLAVPAIVGVVVSLRASSVRLALTAMVGGWILLVLILPRLASTTADDLRPLPSSQAVHQQMLDEAPAYWSAEDTVRHQRQLLARYGAARIEDVPNARMAELDLVERHSQSVFDRVLGDFYGRVAGQDRLFATFGLVSPIVAAQVLSAALAGTDFPHQRAFIDAAEAYRRGLVNRMNAEGMAHAAYGDERYSAGNELWRDIPAFAYAPPQLAKMVRGVSVAVVAWFLWLFGAWWLLWRTSGRIRP